MDNLQTVLSALHHKDCVYTRDYRVTGSARRDCLNMGRYDLFGLAWWLAFAPIEFDEECYENEVLYFYETNDHTRYSAKVEISQEGTDLVHNPILFNERSSPLFEFLVERAAQACRM